MRRLKTPSGGPMKNFQKSLTKPKKVGKIDSAEKSGKGTFSSALEQFCISCKGFVNALDAFKNKH